MDAHSGERSDIYKLTTDEKLSLIRDLFGRSKEETTRLAESAFRQRFPDAPDSMIKSAVFHVYVDGIEAARDWLVETERFLHDPSHSFHYGIEWDLLNHLYNWHVFQALLPHGSQRVLDLLGDVKQFVKEKNSEAAEGTLEMIEKMFGADQAHPDLG